MDNSLKLNVELPNPAFLSKYPKELKTRFWRNICKPTFIAALFTFQEVEGIYVFIDGWMDIENIQSCAQNKVLLKEQ
jgi:hypothetical protein